MRIKQTFEPVLPLLRSVKQAERCGGALPPNPRACLLPAVSPRKGPEYPEYDEDDEVAAVVFGGAVAGEQPEACEVESEVEVQEPAADASLGWRPRRPSGPPPVSEQPQRFGGRRHRKLHRRGGGGPKIQSLDPLQRSSTKLPQLACSFSGDKMHELYTSCEARPVAKQSATANRWKSGQTWSKLNGTMPSGSRWIRKSPSPPGKGGSDDAPAETAKSLQLTEAGQQMDAKTSAALAQKQMEALGLVQRIDNGGWSPQRTQLSSLQEALRERDEKAQSCMMPNEFIKTTVEAFQSSQTFCDLPDVHRVIWRGGALNDSADVRSSENLELARHRRDKSHEFGEDSRRVAREHCRNVLLRERRILHSKKKQRLRSLESTIEVTEDGASEYKSEEVEALSPRSLALGGDGEGRRSSAVLLSIVPKQKKMQRLSTLKEVHRHRQQKERMSKLFEARQKAFLALPEAERNTLTSSFEKADVNGSDTLNARQLRCALEELGLAPKNDVEKREVRNIIGEVGVIGDCDFFHFCSEAVPRTREKLRELRRGPLLHSFKMYDGDNSGYLDVEECEMILTKAFTFCLDEKGQELMRKAFLETLKSVVTPELGEVDFDGFEALMANSQEHYQRILLERETDIMTEEDLSQEDVAEHRGEMVALYDTFSRGDFDGNAGMDRDELRPVLIEYGLQPKTQDGQKRISDTFEMLDDDEDGSLDFAQFLQMMRFARQLLKLTQADLLQRMFEKYERDNEGTIHMTEVSILLSEMGLVPRCRDDQQEMKKILDSHYNGSGHVGFVEFQMLVLRITEYSNSAKRRRERDTAAELAYADEEVAELRDAFHALDEGGIGSLTIDKLRTALDLLRKPIAAVHLQEIFATLDPDDTGGVGFQQFLHFMKAVTSGMYNTLLPRESTLRDRSGIEGDAEMYRQKSG